MANINDYVSQVISQVKNNATKREIKRELEAHINDRIEYYTDAGYDIEYATEAAISKMGDPEKVASSMKKIHNNIHYVILSLIFTSLYIAGLVFANINAVDFAVINMVDFEEIHMYSSIVSVLIFFSGSFAFLFGRKSKESGVLAFFGVTSIVGNVASMYALIPFGYQVLSLVTDFPVAIINKEHLFYSNEVFWKLDGLFVGGMPYVLYYGLIILSVLISLLSVVVGIVAIVLANEYRKYDVSKGFDNKAKKLSVFLVVLSVVTLAGTFAECIYDNCLYYAENKEFRENLQCNYNEAKTVFDELEIPMTKEEAMALQEKYDISEYDMSDMEFGMITVIDNGAYFVQLHDDDDGIYNCKRFCANVYNVLDKRTVKELEKLEKGSSIEELNALVDFSDYSEYYITITDDSIEQDIFVCSKSGTHYEFCYTNGTLDVGTFIGYDD